MQDKDPITLDQPIQRGQTQIASIRISKPSAGQLRGTKLVDLLQMDVGALITLLPRITLPPLTEQEVQGMDPADLTECGIAVASFLGKKERLPSEADTASPAA
ncbi:phage tail assembly protein [Chromobacterium haemolyticum]|uniref:phage tail assembly protein n=1 Tax=Chromobacterium haemolyticum TaxID=394935 RepID=UPI0005BA5E33|nr:phage tail assembly protein [Chromobacterium haemolyticum]BBH14546.1 hypothetical protein CH06BL_37940 [Chromobacterium haemolyticum]